MSKDNNENKETKKVYFTWTWVQMLIAAVVLVLVIIISFIASSNTFTKYFVKTYGDEFVAKRSVAVAVSEVQYALGDDSMTSDEKLSYIEQAISVLDEETLSNEGGESDE